MFNIGSIIEGNRKTFYNYASNKKLSTWPRTVAFLVIAIVLGILLSGDIKDALNGVITSLAILIGFSFTVMFFLVSRDLNDDRETNVLEDKLKREKISRLSKELFYNVSYFNIVSLTCVCLAVVLMVPRQSEAVWDIVVNIPEPIRSSVTGIYGELSPIVLSVLRSVFFYLLIESTYSFIRTTGRITYLFGEKLPSDT